MQPFSDEHRQLLEKLIKSTAETREYLIKCKTCGVDVDREIKTNDEQAAIAQSFLDQFFPVRN